MLPNHHNQLRYRLALTFIQGIGSIRAKALLNHFGDVEAIFNAGVKELKHVDGMTETVARQFKEGREAAFEKAAAEMQFIDKHGLQVLWIEEENYPQRLKQCVDAPVLLFYKGNGRLNAAKTVAVVGTRRCTEYGHGLCEELIAGLKDEEDIIIISGLADGIDTMAHKAALKNNIPTIGVVGHSHDKMYPAANRSLAKEMQETGGVLSEFPSGTIPDKSNFPMRNRVVAGMSDITVVVESPVKGGALITAYIAGTYNREVAAFPGRVHDTRSAGCNELIRTNNAAMITSADDLLELMGWQKTRKQKPVQKQLFITLSAEEQKLVDLLQAKDSVHADELLHQSGLTNSQLAATLLQLEMQGLVKTLPGKYYRMN